MLAVDRTVHGKSVLVLAAVTGQTGPVVLAQAGLHALALVDAVAPLIGSTQVLPGNQVVAHVSEAGHRLGAETSSSVSMLTWPGVSATRVFVPARHVADQARRGTRIGTVVVTVGTQQVGVPVRLRGTSRPRRSSNGCSDRLVSPRARPGPCLVGQPRAGLRHCGRGTRLLRQRRHRGGAFTARAQRR